MYQDTDYPATHELKMIGNSPVVLLSD